MLLNVVWLALCMFSTAQTAPNLQIYNDVQAITADSAIKSTRNEKSARNIVSDNSNFIQLNLYKGESEHKNIWTRSHSDKVVKEIDDWSTELKSVAEEVRSFAKRLRHEERADFGGISLTCGTCTIILNLGKVLVASNTSEETIENTVNSICVSMQIETPRVCRGIIDGFAPQLLYVLSHIDASPKDICNTFLDDCNSAFDPFNNWNVTLPPTPQPQPVPPILPKKGSPTLRVLHLTDVHYDPEYKEGANAECGEPLCCRDGAATKSDGSDGAWLFGDYRSCDSPLWTLENLFQTLAAENDTFDYVIWTGDVPAHNVWNQSRDDQINIIHQVVGLLQKYLPGKPVFPSLGNHESTPVNSFPPPYVTGEHAINWLYDVLADSWKVWLPQDTLDTIRRGGYYAVSPYPGLKIISLNMNYCNSENWWMLVNTTDPTGELQWLISELQHSEDNKGKAHILGHIPPGNNDCLKSWSWNYYRIVSRYQNTITGQFFGHTHRDQFNVFYDAETLKTPINVAYIAPSVTSYVGLNMGYRFYTIDGSYISSSYQVLDHETYFLNLTRAHIEKKITWEFEYSAKAAYNMPSLFPRDWNNVIERMKTNDTLLQLFNKHIGKSVDSGACDEDCRKSVICGTRSGRSHDPGLCEDLFETDVEYDKMQKREKHFC